jgi:hypothetical protein
VYVLSVAITTTDDAMTSDLTTTSATADSNGVWAVSDRPGQRFTRNQAVIAMMAAEERAKPEPDPLFIKSLESELR